MSTSSASSFRLGLQAALAAVSMASYGTAWAATNVNCTQNPGALHSALAAAQPGNTLRIDGTCVGTYTIDKNLTLTGHTKATLDGNGVGPVVTVIAGVHVVLDNLVVRGGMSLDSVAVGGIDNHGHLEITGSTITGNVARGVIFATGGIASGPLGSASISLERSEVIGNSAVVISTDSGQAAGGMRTDGPVTISRSDLRENEALATTGSANRAFGAIAIGAGGGLLDRVTITGNVARSEHTGSTGSGLVAGAIGGLTHFTGDLTIEDSVVSGNRAVAVSAVGSGSAGGMVTRMTTVTKTRVTGNTAEAGTLAVGGIANHNAVLVLEKSDVTGNTATAFDAGGIAGAGIVTGYATTASTTLDKTAVTDNLAFGSDAVGGLYRVSGTGAYALDKSHVQRNQPVDCNFAGCEP